MSDPAVVVSYAANLCWSIWRLAKAVGNFNYHLVSTLFRLAKEGWAATYVFATALASASCDIISYFYEFLVEFGCFLAVLCRLAAQLLLLVAQFFLCVYAALERVAVVTGELLLAALQWLFLAISDGLSKLHTSTEGLKNSILSSLCSFWNIVSFTCGEVLGYVHQSAVEIVQCMSSTFMNIGSYLASNVQHGFELITDAIKSVTITSVNLCKELWWYSWDSINQHILLHDVYLTVGLIIIVISLLRVLVIMFRKYGLTVPFLGQFVITRGTVARTTSLHNDAMDDFIFVSDEEEEEEDAVEEIEVDDESDEGSSDTEVTSEVESFADEFEVVDDSDFESGDENDQNVINIQLTSPSTRYSLRERASCSPARSFSKLSPKDLERFLENERDKRLCVVCQDNPKNVLILPCKHMCMCVACAHEIATSSNYNRRICPLCRSRINTVMDVFV